MKARTVILLAVIAILLASSVAPAQSGRPPGYVVHQAALSGSGYRLTSPAWSLGGAASGGRYYLLGQAALAGGRCCCTWLPIVMRR